MIWLILVYLVSVVASWFVLRWAHKENFLDIDVFCLFCMFVPIVNWVIVTQIPFMYWLDNGRFDDKFDRFITKFFKL